jgi:4-hydroxy-tetrahydrodipicolinate reductase
MIRIAIAGAGGRMGRTLIEGVLAADDLALAAALDVPGSPGIGRDAGEGLGRAAGVPITIDIRGGIGAADCIIDFTRPDGTMAHVDACVALGRAAIIGTTGFTTAQKDAIAAAAKRIPIVLAPNFAVGVNAVIKLAEVAARILGEDYDVEIIEAHHRHKVDAPSGTALRLGEVVAKALGRDLAKDAVHGREGDTGARTAREIGFHAIRGGDIVGEHTVMFAGEGERVEVTVRSGNRMTYAVGALRAARWAHGRAPGLYDMSDVLGLR